MQESLILLLQNNYNAVRFVIYLIQTLIFTAEKNVRVFAFLETLF